MKTKRKKANNCHIDTTLYNFYLRLKDTMGAEIVHRRRRKSTTCIEIIFYNELYKYLNGRLNTLKEAEKWGYWVICRRQTKRGHETWHGKAVFQLFLTPVHPKKRREMAHKQEVEISFEPIYAAPKVRHRVPMVINSAKKSLNNLHMCEKSCTFGRRLYYVHSPESTFAKLSELQINRQNHSFMQA